MLRIVLLGLVITLVAHLVRRVATALLRPLRSDRQEVEGTPKKPSDRIDRSKAKDAEFRDLEN